jgi:hypothetical protein
MSISEDFGLRILDCGLRQSEISSPKSEIHNLHNLIDIALGTIILYLRQMVEILNVLTGI